MFGACGSTQISTAPAVSGAIEMPNSRTPPAIAWMRAHARRPSVYWMLARDHVVFMIPKASRQIPPGSCVA